MKKLYVYIEYRQILTVWCKRNLNAGDWYWTPKEEGVQYFMINDGDPLTLLKLTHDDKFLYENF